MRARLAAAVVVGALLASGAGPAGADPGGGINDGGDGVVIDDSDTVPGSPGDGQPPGPPGDGDGSGSSGPSEPQPWWESRFVPNCSVNAPVGGADALCGAAVNSCPADGQIRYREYRRLVQPDGSRGEWQFDGTVCRGADEPAGVVTPEVTPEMVVEAAQSLAPESAFVVEPADRTLVNFPTNFASRGGGATETVYVLGQAIVVRFEPTSHVWDLGDGATATGRGVSGADVGQAGAVEHEYARRGEYDVSLRRVFTASFALPDGEQVSIPGEISTTSEPYALDVQEVQSLVQRVD